MIMWIMCSVLLCEQFKRGSDDELSNVDRNQARVSKAHRCPTMSAACVGTALVFEFGDPTSLPKLAADFRPYPL